MRKLKMTLRLISHWRGFTYSAVFVCLFPALVATIPADRAQGGEARCREAPQKAVQRTYGADYDPGRNRPAGAESEDWRISFIGAEPCQDCSSGKLFLFEARDKRTGTTKQFRIANETFQIDETRLVPGARVVVVGRAAAYIYTVTVVDLKAARVLDWFLCFRPSVSDDNRLVAYVKLYPIHFMKGVSNEYLVYDLTANPQENRVGRGNAHSGEQLNIDLAVDVGLPLYPAGSKNTRGDNILDDESLAHGDASYEFFWLNGNHILGFADRWQGVNRLILADLRGGVRKPQVTVIPIDTEQIVDTTRCKDYAAEHPEYAFYVSGISFAGGGEEHLCVHFSTLSSSPCLRREVLEIPLPLPRSR